MKPVDNIIPRQIEDKELEKILGSFSLGLDKVVDFGSNLLKWDIETANVVDDNLPILLSLRHFLDLIDSTSILIKKSSADPAKLLLRGALETYFSLEYLFEKDTQQRCMAFLVWHTHKELKAYKCLDNSTQQSKQLEQALKKDPLLKDFSIPEIPGLDKAISNLESLLSLPIYQQAEAEYQRLVSLDVKNPAWHELFNGPKNTYELANYLRLSSLYETLYREWSGPTHGTDILKGKILSNNANTADIVQIRYAKDAQSIVSSGMTISLLTFKTFVKNRLPEKEEEYKKWYLTIRDLYRQVTSQEQLIRIV